MRDRMGDQTWQASEDAEKSLVFWHHYRVLEFHGRDLLARGVGAVGDSQLREGSTAAGRGHRTRRQSGALPKYSRGLGVPGELVHHRVSETQKNKEMLTREKASDIFERIRRFSSADEVEAIFTGSRFALTRFANNTIHQNVEEENAIVSVRTNFAGDRKSVV